ncbi:MAG: hypothetical protein ACLFV8_05030 [Alphaproteobacteria bacterium]
MHREERAHRTTLADAERHARRARENGEEGKARAFENMAEHMRRKLNEAEWIHNPRTE